MAATQIFSGMPYIAMGVSYTVPHTSHASIVDRLGRGINASSFCQRRPLTEILIGTSDVVEGVGLNTISHNVNVNEG